MPVFLECQRCTACCRWPGQVRLDGPGIARLAAFLKLDEFVFIQEFTRLASDRRGLALADQPDGACVFLKDGGCAVQPVKPQQCRDFPNLWNLDGPGNACRAIPVAMDHPEYVRRVAHVTQRTPEQVSEILRRREDVRANS